MLKNRMNLSIILIYGAVMVFITILQVIILAINPNILDDESLLTTFSSITNLILYLSLFLIFLILFHKYFIEQLIDLNNRKVQIISILVIGFITMIAASAISTMILEALGVTEPSDNQAALDMLITGTLFDKISLFVFAVFLAPLVEEFVFRKAVLNMFHFKINNDTGRFGSKFRKVVSASIAILISSLAFGFIHVTSGDYIQIIYYAFLGVVLGVLYIVSKKNIYVPIFVHFLTNLMVTSFMLFG